MLKAASVIIKKEKTNKQKDILFCFFDKDQRYCHYNFYMYVYISTAYLLDENLKHIKKQNKQIFLFWTLRKTKKQNIVFYNSSVTCLYKQRWKESKLGKKSL